MLDNVASDICPAISLGGYFDVHHESTAFLRRYATLLYYLDGPGEGGGGGTVFPLGPDGTGGGRGVVGPHMYCPPRHRHVI